MSEGKINHENCVLIICSTYPDKVKCKASKNSVDVGVVHFEHNELRVNDPEQSTAQEWIGPVNEIDRQSLN